MLTKEKIEVIVKDCMEKYAKENDGSQGWAKEDIQNAVLREGGDEKDVYEAMAVGFEKCTGEKIEPVRTMLN